MKNHNFNKMNTRSKTKTKLNRVNDVVTRKKFGRINMPIVSGRKLFIKLTRFDPVHVHDPVDPNNSFLNDENNSQNQIIFAESSAELNSINVNDLETDTLYNMEIRDDGELMLIDSIDIQQSNADENEFMEAENSLNLNEKRDARLRTITSRNRMYGKPYLGYSRSKIDNKYIILQNKNRAARIQKPACTSILCLKSKYRKCDNFSEEERFEIFSAFWPMDWEQKKLYVLGLMESLTPKQKIDNNSRRGVTFLYYLVNQRNERLQVCQKMFLNTLGLSEKMVREWRNKSEKFYMQLSPEVASDKRKSSRKISRRAVAVELQKTLLDKYLDDFPKLESHYSRKDSRKLYFQCDFQSKIELYRDYKRYCRESNSEPFSKFPFLKTLKDRNYSLFKPKKDECDICVQFKTGNLEQNSYEKHRNKIVKARNEKKIDTEQASEGKCALFCMDVQAVKVVPQLNCSSQYYKMKLQLHNFTIYNIESHDSVNHIWDETEGQVVASCFTTCVTTFLKNYIDVNTNIKRIIIYSDGCGYQNRNIVLSNALLNLCQKYDLTIEQKYLVKGHTQMECDSTHSLIERRVKNKVFYLPSDFTDHVRLSRMDPKPLIAHHLHHEFFLNYDIPELKRYNSIRPGKFFKFQNFLLFI